MDHRSNLALIPSPIRHLQPHERDEVALTPHAVLLSTLEWVRNVQRSGLVQHSDLHQIRREIEGVLHG